MSFIKMLLCLHYWSEQHKFATMLGVIVKWKCDKCGKTIERDIDDPPVSYIEDKINQLNQSK